MESLAATERLSEIFSDRTVLQCLLDFEAALARAEAGVGLFAGEAAAAIERACTLDGFDVAKLSHDSFRAGTPAIPLVRMLREKVRTANPEAAEFVHWGATSQDVTDTTLVRLLIRCRQVLQEDHDRVILGLRRLAEEHAHSVMLGRTLLQPAPPITFGLKAAEWLAAIRRGWSRVASRFDEAAYLQFGGATGTLAALEGDGIAVAEALARQLDLKCPDAPWHSHRDRLAALMAALSVYVGSLGKMALDIALLMQHEVAEVSEPGGEGRGGSSTMPHKHNPTACTLAIAAAKRTPGLLANYFTGMLQEHERAIGAWQSEWSIVEAIIQATGVALEAMVEVAEGLKVDAARMRSNIDSTEGAVFAEQAITLSRRGSASAVAQKFEPEGYLGSAEIFRQRLLRED
jgi:3-carboxy-cis,cis-muconate cycloisomerase